MVLIFHCHYLWSLFYCWYVRTLTKPFPLSPRSWRCIVCGKICVLSMLLIGLGEGVVLEKSQKKVKDTFRCMHCVAVFFPQREVVFLSMFTMSTHKYFYLPVQTFFCKCTLSQACTVHCTDSAQVTSSQPGSYQDCHRI